MSFDQKEIFTIMYKLCRFNHEDIRVEMDAMGSMHVPLDRLYGAHTARALMNFPPGGAEERMPRAIIIALGLIKKAGAMTNRDFGMEPNICDAIAVAADEVISGKLYDEGHFPLSIWQEGSGSNTNMNVNEVICNRGLQRLGGELGSQLLMHPQKYVNLAHSPNDSFSSAINIAVALELNDKLFPALRVMLGTMHQKEKLWKGIVKIGRTHLMDAVPLTLGQEFSGYRQVVENNIQRLSSSLDHLYQLALGDTTAGTGKNAPDRFGVKTGKKIARLTHLPFVCAPNLFEAISTRDCLVEVHGALNSIAVSTMKIAGDIMRMGSGPNCGLGELLLPKNEPGSSIMPGMEKPSQCEAMMMMCAQVMGNQVAVTVGGYNGQFQLNAFMPVIASNVLRSINLLSSGVKNFTTNCLDGIEPHLEKLEKTLEQSLMMITAVTPQVGYDKAVQIAKAAATNGTTLKQEAINAGVSKEDVDTLMTPSNMLGPAE